MTDWEPSGTYYERNGNSCAPGGHHSTFGYAEFVCEIIAVVFPWCIAQSSGSRAAFLKLSCSVYWWHMIATWGSPRHIRRHHEAVSCEATHLNCWSLSLFSLPLIFIRKIELIINRAFHVKILRWCDALNSWAQCSRNFGNYYDGLCPEVDH
jgi:hypothetical protein